MANNPLATVQQMFQAFGSGNVDEILKTVSPDSKWTYLGANPTPAQRTYNGHEEVRKFFETILNNLEMTSFTPKEFIVQDETVVVLGEEAGTVKATGQPFRNEWMQQYVVRENRIVEMKEYNIQVPGSDKR